MVPVIVLLFGMFQVVLGSTIPSGLYAIYEESWGLSRSQTTVIFAMYVVGVLSSLIVLGGLADRWGRKPAILLSISFALASSTVFLVAHVTPLIYLGRLLSGLSVGLCTGAFTSALGDFLGRGRGAAWSAIVTSGALAAGPLASAIVAILLPHPLRLPFLVHIILLSIVALTCWRLPDSPHHKSHSQANNAHGAEANKTRIFQSLTHIITFLCCTSVIGWAYGANGMWQSVVPLSAGLNNQLLIATLTALMLGVSAVAQWVTMRLDSHRIIVPGLVILGSGLGLSALSLMMQHSWLLWVATCVVGMGQGTAFRSSLSLAAENATRQRQASAISLYYIFGYVMTAALPLASNAWNVPIVLWVMVALSMGSVIAIWFTKKG